MSSLTWLAFSESERRQVLDALSNLRDRDTRDELGIGVVRDAISDSLFPGTSTIMTRTRYLLILDWTYRLMEEKGVSSGRAKQYSIDLEKRTVEVLRSWDPSAGVIGAQAGAALLRMPSEIYWQALRSWSIRRFSGGRSDYFRSLDGFYRRQKDRVRVQSDDEAEETAFRNWDDELPIPTHFPTDQTLDLTRSEAEYLRARYRIQHADTYLAWLVDHCDGPISEEAQFPWDYKAAGLDPAKIPPRNREQLEHAEMFALATYGATLLYNHMLTEKVSPDSEHVALREQYARDIELWHQEMVSKEPRLRAWTAGISEFWAMIDAHSVGATWTAQRPFIEQWLVVAMDPSRRAALTSDTSAKRLIIDREVALKRGLARLAGGRALDLWSGASGIGRYRYRWHRVRVLVNDLVEGMGR